jgi:ribosomal protein L3
MVHVQAGKHERENALAVPFFHRKLTPELENTDMKKTIVTVTAIATSALAFPAWAADGLADKVGKASNCREVSALVATALKDAGGSKAAIEDVKASLKASLEAKPVCACEITTATIVATGASDKERTDLIEAIVETAVRTLPDRTAEIAECAVAAAPEHSATIEKTLKRIFSENEDEYQGGKSVDVVEDSKGKDKGVTVVDYEPVAPYPAPIYLIAPGGGFQVPGVSPINGRRDDDDDFFDDDDDFLE